MTTKTAIPWNKGRAVGQKRPFSKDEIQAIARELEQQKKFRDLSLFCLGIDTMLRGSDLIRLKVSDVMNSNRHPKPEINWHQQKTKTTVVSALCPYAQSAVCAHVATLNLKPDSYLFLPKRSGGTHISTSTLRTLVKSWARMIGLSDEDYSSHSLRRTKPAQLYAKGVRPEMLRLLLGHQNLQSTQAYLGIDQHDALELARKHDCFRFSK